MGIPGLARRLEPYGVRYSREELAGCNAIVDGPSLAYHAHTLALSAVGSQSRIPSYADINTQAIRWLKGLEDINIKVSAILFDGALPHEKKDVRVSRLEKNNKKVRELRILYPHAACPIPACLGSGSYALLAPALREALSESKYASVTRIVPGEADDWCAPYANESRRPIVFSSDTDLFLYEYPSNGLLAFFRNVELSPEPKFKCYSPSRICENLGLTSLVHLAYAVTQDNTKPLNNLVEDTKAKNFESSQFSDFSNRYTNSVIKPFYLFCNSELRAAMQKLDVRTSEFVYQALDGVSIPDVYLPLLVEDANQASAWNVGQDIRLLAYSLFTPSCKMVNEYKRKAQAIVVHEIIMVPLSDTRTEAIRVAEDLSAWWKWTTDKQVPEPFVWPLIALSLVLPDLKLQPKISTIVHVLKGNFDNDWGFIQLTARLQAALYSLRLLKQCITVWLTIQTSPDELRTELVRFHQDLECMPTIAELFLVPGQKKLDGKEGILRDVINAMYASLDMEPGPESNRKMKKQKREAERKESKRKEGAKQSNNPFALLDQGS